MKNIFESLKTNKEKTILLSAFIVIFYLIGMIFGLHEFYTLLYDKKI